MRMDLKDNRLIILSEDISRQEHSDCGKVTAHRSYLALYRETTAKQKDVQKVPFSRGGNEFEVVQEKMRKQL